MSKTKAVSLKAILSAENPEEVVQGLSFEDGMHLLEELVEKVESGALPLDKAVLSYERGVALIERLRGLLSGAEEKLRVLQAGGGS
jgi:exodeoxyribonuclease VII small subunit